MPTQESNRVTSFLDEDLQRDKAALGIEAPSTVEEYFSTATPENIRNFARSYGDDNALYADPNYGPHTRWRTQIAPSIMSAILNKPLRETQPPPRLGSLRGVSAFVSGGTWEWFQPILPGDTLHSFSCLLSSDVRSSKSTGTVLLRTRRTVKINQRAEVVGIHSSVMVYTPPTGASSQKKNAPESESVDSKVPRYTDDDLARIDDLYEREEIRGADPRWAEDVTVGDHLPPMVKGPLTVTDIIIFHAGGYGFAPYGLKTGRPGYLNRKRIPGFYSKNEYEVPDVAQRMHWDAERAQATGSSRPYDFGVLRECWFHQYLTSWMGDDAWIARQETRIRKFNCIGDTQYLSGAVSSISHDGSQTAVEVTAEATNQWGEQTTTMVATVLLPSRSYGPPIPPLPSNDLRRRAYAMMIESGGI